MEITSAEFVISNTDVKKCPAGIFPEYAFIGRSNVGKSSLINMLTSRKGLAMTSSTPGKTMLINHFLINKNWYLVDLPGYGYARRGQKGKDQIRTIIEDYILEREQMTNLFVLIDSRLEPQKIAESIRAHWAIENNLHWQLDVSFNEDAGRKTGNAAQNVSLMNKIALMVIKKNERKGSVKGKRKAAGWDNELLCELLSMKYF